MKNDNGYTRLLDLINNDMPKMSRGFAGLEQTATASATLDSKSKHLTAMAIAALSGSEESLRLHASRALSAGATQAEMLEATAITVFFGGEPAAFNAGKACAIIEEMTGKKR